MGWGESPPVRRVGYDRVRLIDVLIYHQRNAPGGCHCGWGERPEHLGCSWAAHIADVYEDVSTMTDDVEVKRPVVPSELWSDYWKRCYIETGISCQLCGCPLARDTQIEGKSPDMVIYEGLRCLFCGEWL